MSKKILLLGIVVFFISAGILYSIWVVPDESNLLVLEDGSVKEPELDVDAANGSSAEASLVLEEAPKEQIVVHISGAVRQPGIYYFDKGARIFEAVEAAGGFLEDAARQYLNLAMKMTDEQKIIVPTVEEAENETYPPEFINRQQEMGTDGRMNINTADLEELMKLPGIGEKKAGSIIEYREKNGFFQSIESIIEVDGISSKILDDIRDSITTE